MKQSRTPRRRAISLALFALLPALLVPSGIASANHEVGHTTGVPDNANVETVTVCHVPPTDGVPSEILSIPVSALGGHLGHGDFVLTPGLTCPATPPPPPPLDVCPNVDGNQATVPAGLVLVDGQCVAPTPPITPDAPTPATPTPDAPTPTPDATPEAAEGDTPAPAADDTTVLGVAEVPADEPTAGAAATADGTLPFTGTPTWVIAVAGMLLVLAGTILHRLGSRRAVATGARN